MDKTDTGLAAARLKLTRMSEKNTGLKSEVFPTRRTTLHREQNDKTPNKHPSGKGSSGAVHGANVMSLQRLFRNRKMNDKPTH